MPIGWSPISQHMLNRAIGVPWKQAMAVRVGQAGISTVITPVGEMSVQPLALFTRDSSAKVERRTERTSSYDGGIGGSELF